MTDVELIVRIKRKYKIYGFSADKTIKDVVNSIYDDLGLPRYRSYEHRHEIYFFRNLRFPPSDVRHYLLFFSFSFSHVGFIPVIWTLDQVIDLVFRNDSPYEDYDYFCVASSMTRSIFHSGYWVKDEQIGWNGLVGWYSGWSCSIDREGVIYRSFIHRLPDDQLNYVVEWFWPSPTDLRFPFEGTNIREIVFAILEKLYYLRSQPDGPRLYGLVPTSVSQGVLNVQVFDILHKPKCNYQESDLKVLFEAMDYVDEGDFDGGPHPASAGFEMLLRDREHTFPATESPAGIWCLLEKFNQIPGDLYLWQFVHALRLYLDKLQYDWTEIAPGTTVILKVIGPWEAFESEVLTFLKQQGLERISQILHANRGDGIANIGGEGFLIVITESPIPLRLANSLYIVTQELKIQTERQWEKRDHYHTQMWFDMINERIEDYNTRKLAERFDHSKVDRFSTYFAKFKTEIASRKP